MVVREEFLNQLRRHFDLNLYEVKIWAALLSRGVSTAGELSEISDVPRSRAYDVLESLEKKGYVVMKLGKPIQYFAVEPAEVVERVKKNIKEDAERHVQQLRELEATPFLLELETLHKKGIEFVEATDLSGALKGKHNIYAHLETLVKKANKSVVLMTTSKGLCRKTEALKPLFQKLAKKGVKIRIVAPLNEECASAVNDLKGVAEVRHSPDVQARFCIVDGQDLLFMLMDDKDVHPSYDIGVWVNTPYFASALENMFNVAWKDFSSKKA